MTTHDNDLQPQQIEIAQVVKDACIHAAREGYESAAISGLCCEGALEAAVSAVRMLDLETVLKEKLDR
jgi:hypothetical protein